VAAIEAGFPQKEIADAAYRYQRELDDGTRTVVGVNKYVMRESTRPETLKIGEAVEHEQLARLAAIKSGRDNAAVERALGTLGRAAAGEGNLIPLMLEAGITCLWPLEIASDIDPVALRRQYGRNLALAGGIDKRELAKSRREIEQELLRRIPPLLDRGGYVPHVDHTVPPDVSYDNFRYYLDMKMKLLGY
jgi:hypothetical protein